MNYISHLTGFFRHVSRDYRLNPTHISLYMALFQQWNLHRFRNPISIAREEVLATSRIHSRVTYHKCLRELHAWDFLHYMPSYNHYRGSLVYMLEFAAEGQSRPRQDTFCTGAEQELDAGCRGGGQELSPSINKTNSLNHLNNLNGRKCARAGESSHTGEQATQSNERKEKSCAEKEKKEDYTLRPPKLEAVRHFFQVNAYREVEATRFFHHYRANGWRVGSQPMQDWQAAAHKWACNAFSQVEAGAFAKDQQHVRDYAAPL